MVDIEWAMITYVDLRHFLYDQNFQFHNSATITRIVLLLMATTRPIYTADTKQGGTVLDGV